MSVRPGDVVTIVYLPSAEGLDNYGYDHVILKSPISTTGFFTIRSQAGSEIEINGANPYLKAIYKIKEGSV